MASNSDSTESIRWLVDENGLHIVTVSKVEGENAVVESVPGSYNSKQQTSWTVPLTSLHSGVQELDQLVNLKSFTNENVVNALIWRGRQQCFYTNCGLFMIALNPFKHIPGLYGPSQIKKWQEDSSSDICATPHVYSVVEMAVRGMMEKQIDQSILVSGVSGAGKTETVKICINYLSSIPGGRPKLEVQINNAGLILESFGNALTIHNQNSSRFGKYTKMYFERNSGMVGAELKTYLLEKTRVSHPPQQERNFHIFYQMLAGMTDEHKSELQLTSWSDFKILRTQPMAQVPESEDRNAFIELVESFSTLGFTEEDIDNIWKTLAAVLHLGNLEFGENKPEGSSSSDDENRVASPSIVDDEGDGISFVANQSTLEVAASLLGVESKDLASALTQLTLKIPSTVLPLTKAKAELSRASLVQEIYERLFGWIVCKLNETLEYEGDPDDCGYVAVLDISGYETLHTNGFEQLTINYTNDKLQQLYNEIIYKEQDEYLAEFGWEPFQFDLDLQNVISLIERKPDGIFPALDEVCYRQHASDAIFISELEAYQNGTPRSRDKNKSLTLTDPQKLMFSINHAPGPVEYCGHSFVVKNRDLLATSLENLMKNSQSLCNVLFEKPGEKGQTSVTKFYMGQLSDLMDAIRETDYSFIKCIKPNGKNVSGLLDKDYISDQVKWAGVIETLQICSRGLPVHVAYSTFASTYGSLIQEVAGEDEKTKTKRIVHQHLGAGPVSADFAFGKTKVYLSMSAHFKLDLLKKTKSNNPDNWISRAKSAFNWLWGTQ